MSGRGDGRQKKRKYYATSYHSYLGMCISVVHTKARLVNLPKADAIHIMSRVARFDKNNNVCGERSNSFRLVIPHGE